VKAWNVGWLRSLPGSLAKHHIEIHWA